MYVKTINTIAIAKEQDSSLPCLQWPLTQVIPSGFSSMEKDYPPFGHTVPSNSIALVAYTVGQYKSSHFPNEKSLSFNLIWAAVLSDGGE